MVSDILLLIILLGSLALPLLSIKHYRRGGQLKFFLTLILAIATAYVPFWVYMITQSTSVAEKVMDKFTNPYLSPALIGFAIFPSLIKPLRVKYGLKSMLLFGATLFCNSLLGWGLANLFFGNTF